jgi:integrase
LVADAAVFDEIDRRVRTAVAPATAVKYMTAVRQLLRHLGRVGVADLEAVVATIDGTRRRTRPESTERRGVTSEEIRAMFAACHRDTNQVKGRRDGALLAVLAGTGARRAEAASLIRPDLDLDTGTAELQVKGGGRRSAPLNRSTLDHVELWLPLLPKGDVGPLFPRVGKDGTIDPARGISAHQAWKLVAARRDEAGLDPGITPHSFRRWFVTSLLEAGVDLLTVTRAVGHRSPNTTQRYDRRGDSVIREAIGHLRLPTPEEITEEVNASGGARSE